MSDSFETRTVHSHPHQILNLQATDVMCWIWVPEYSWLYFKIAKLPVPLAVQTPCMQRQESVLSSNGQSTSITAAL